MATYHVTVNGDDSTGDGSLANPWRTIAYGIDQLTGLTAAYGTGDKLQVHSGAYVESVRIGDGTAMGITVETVDGDVAVDFDGQQGPLVYRWWSILGGATGRWKWSGLSAFWIVGNGSQGRVKIRGIDITGPGSGNLISAGLRDSCDIADLTVRGVAQFKITSTDDDCTLSGLDVAGVADVAISLTGADSVCEHLTIRDRTLATGAVVHCPTIRNSSGVGCKGSKLFQAEVLIENCHYHDWTGSAGQELSGGATITGTVTGAPLFVDGPAGDLRLQYDSPLRAVGAASSAEVYAGGAAVTNPPNIGAREALPAPAPDDPFDPFKSSLWETLDAVDLVRIALGTRGVDSQGGGTAGWWADSFTADDYRIGWRIDLLEQGVSTAAEVETIRASLARSLRFIVTDGHAQDIQVQARLEGGALRLTVGITRDESAGGSTTLLYPDLWEAIRNGSL